jgi:Nucleotide modification associated domain 2
MVLFSYVVDHDKGYAPNPHGGICTLVQCKYSKGKRKNIIEMAEKGDWIIGTGGNNPMSAGHGTIIYLMRVDKKMPLSEYVRTYTQRSDSDYLWNEGNRFALISRKYFYFGRNALPINLLPKKLRHVPLEKKGPGYRRDFIERFVQELTSRFASKFKVGIHGRPCCDTENDLRVRHKCK